MSLKIHALVCDTLCQGLIVSSGDLYLTKAEAEAELVDMHKSRADADMDEEEDFSVVEAVLHEDGKVFDTFGSPIEVTDIDSDDAKKQISELLGHSIAGATNSPRP